MIPEYLSQRAATEDLDCLITVNIAQQQVEETMQLQESDDDSPGMQLSNGPTQSYWALFSTLSAEWLKAAVLFSPPQIPASLKGFEKEPDIYPESSAS